MTVTGTWKHNLQEGTIAAFDNQFEADRFHLKTIGKMIEFNETAINNEAFEHYAGKTRQITNNCRKLETNDFSIRNPDVQSELV